MILLFYNLALLGALILGAPWWLFRLATTQKYRDGLWERLGRVRGLAGQAGRPLIWIHAVSVGEVLAVAGAVDVEADGVHGEPVEDGHGDGGVAEAAE